MSHVTTVEFVFRDLDSLKEAVIHAGAEWREGQRQFHAYFGNNNPCDHAIHVPGSRYEIGVTHNAADNTYKLAYDNWVCPENTLHATFGNNLRNLKNTYTATTSVRRLRKQGFRELSRHIDEFGRLHVQVGR